MYATLALLGLLTIGIKSILQQDKLLNTSRRITVNSCDMADLIPASYCIAQLIKRIKIVQ